MKVHFVPHTKHPTFFTTMTIQLIMFKETVALCSENHRKITSLCEQNAEILYFKEVLPIAVNSPVCFKSSSF